MHHPKVRHVHMTGSAATHDAIVFGTGTEGAGRKKAGTPLLDKPATSELGGVSPRSCCRAAGPRRTCATRPSTSPPRSCTTTATTAQRAKRSSSVPTGRRRTASWPTCEPRWPTHPPPTPAATTGAPTPSTRTATTPNGSEQAAC
ncbi:aldehyde dehydrogenase family protein [Streptomyces sp. HP-A2021]|uniref:aldehyde dehydrogenase family protein n=1 Tax=Streptomyces sp. HP-A2021 TaxID=2927875 RepID=UPI001FAEA2A2|nr:aldehyde dehydrogenase family protein [Streptomyces sp. HP-A2021]UOB08415.1 aldehyde dehydrogenase family protein [Streptomyces sp. HP-A2021]